MRIHLDIFGIGMVNLTSIIFSDFLGLIYKSNIPKKRNSFNIRAAHTKITHSYSKENSKNDFLHLLYFPFKSVHVTFMLD